jgi:FkbM family methyltransferase
MQIKKQVARFAEQLGYHIIPKWRMRDLAFAQHLGKLLQHYEVDALIDVGANRGQYRDFLRMEVGYAGPILSYEPQPACYEILRQRSRDEASWEIRNLALGASPGELSLNVTAGDSMSSFLQPENTHVNGFEKWSLVRETVVVPVTTLDAELELAQNSWLQERRIYLKLDTQGFDLNVLRGARESLSRVVAVQSELSVKPMYQNMPDFREVIDFLAAAGFELSGVFPVNHDANLAVIELDGVFINSRFAKPRET